MTDERDTRSPQELADLIDQLMAQGSGHVNIAADENDGLIVDTVKSSDCGTSKGACCQPTENAIDEDED